MSPFLRWPWALDSMTKVDCSSIGHWSRRRDANLKKNRNCSLRPSKHSYKEWCFDNEHKRDWYLGGHFDYLRRFGKAWQFYQIMTESDSKEKGELILSRSGLKEFLFFPFQCRIADAGVAFIRFSLNLFPFSDHISFYKPYLFYFN